jgi:AraC family L-rhamnose operon transcriptional activator RhaR
MDWIGRLNATVSRLPIGAGRIEVLSFAHSSDLETNQPHRHTSFEACLVGPTGAGTYTDQGRSWSLSPSTFFVARPGEIHQIRVDDREAMDLSWIVFSWVGDGASPQTDAERLMRRFVASDQVLAQDDGRVGRLFAALRAVAEQPSLGFREQAEALTTALILAMAQILTPADSVEAEFDREHHAAQQAVRFIQDNLNRSLSVGEIARHVFLSERQLLRVFARFTGESPARYTLLARLDRAAALLKDGNLAVKEIAVECGFADAAHFNRVFVRRHQVSPGAYRRGERGANVPSLGALV